MKKHKGIINICKKLIVFMIIVSMCSTPLTTLASSDLEKTDIAISGTATDKQIDSSEEFTEGKLETALSKDTTSSTVEPSEETKEEVKEEIKDEVKEETKEETKEEIKEEIKEKIKEEIKEETKEEVKEETKEEVEEEVKEEVKEDVKEEKVEETGRATEFTVVNGILKQYTGTDTNVVVPNDLGITSIAMGAFNGVKATLETIDIQASITELAPMSFGMFMKLKEVTLPASVGKIGGSPWNPSAIDIGSAFMACNQLKAIHIHANNATFASHKGVVYSAGKTTLYYVPSGLTGEYSIPAETQAIGFNAIQRGTTITNLIVPETVTSMDAGCIADVTRVQQITGVKDSVADHYANKIGEFASRPGNVIPFQAVSTEEPDGINPEDYIVEDGVLVDYVGEEKVNIVIPDTLGITAIKPSAMGRPGAFDKVKATMETIDIQAEVSTLQAGTFMMCMKLKEVGLPAALTTIDGNNGFMDMGVGAVFMGCRNIEKITVPEENTSFSTDEHAVLYNKEKTKLYFFPTKFTVTDYVIPETTEELCLAAVQASVSIENLTIPASVTKIDPGFIASATSVDNIKGITGSAAHTYADTKGINFISIGGEVDTKVKVFYYLGDGEERFIEVEKGTTFGEIADPAIVNPIRENYTFIDWKINDWSTDAKYTVDPKMVIEDTTKIYYYGVKTENFQIEDGVLYGYYDDEADPEDYPDKLVLRPELGITSIADKAFYDSNFKEIIVMDGIQTIGKEVFAFSYYLEKLYIGKDVERIGERTFYALDHLTEIQVNANNKAYCDVDGILFTKEKDTLLKYPEAKTGAIYTTPNATHTIAEGAFDFNKNLVTIELPEVTKIEDNGLSNLQKTIEINMPKVTYFGYEALNYSTKLQSLNLLGKITHIGEKAFIGLSAITEVTLGEWIDDSLISVDTFQYWKNLSRISVHKDNTDFASENGVLYTKDMSELILYPLAKTETTLTVHAKTTTIGATAFKGNTTIKEIVLPDGLLHIEEDALNGCTALQSINLEDTKLETLAGGAFTRCESLTSIVLPASTKFTGTLSPFIETGLQTLVFPVGFETIPDLFNKFNTPLQKVVIEDANTEIWGDHWKNHRDLTIYGPTESKARDFAEAEGIPFIALDGETVTPSDFKVYDVIASDNGKQDGKSTVTVRWDDTKTLGVTYNIVVTDLTTGAGSTQTVLTGIERNINSVSFTYPDNKKIKVGVVAVLGEKETVAYSEFVHTLVVEPTKRPQLLLTGTLAGGDKSLTFTDFADVIQQQDVEWYDGKTHGTTTYRAVSILDLIWEFATDYTLGTTHILVKSFDANGNPQEDLYYLDNQEGGVAELFANNQMLMLAMGDDKHTYGDFKFIRPQRMDEYSDVSYDINTQDFASRVYEIEFCAAEAPEPPEIPDPVYDLSVDGNAVTDTYFDYADIVNQVEGIHAGTYEAKNSMGYTEDIAFKGITIPYLLETILEVDADAEEITFTSTDGYSQTFDLQDSNLFHKDKKGNYPILAFEEDGKEYSDFRFVIGQYNYADFNKDLWVSHVNRITISKEEPEDPQEPEEEKEYIITATANTGGTISPAGAVIVPEHGKKTFRISAKTGYTIQEVFVNEKAVGAVSQYTFTDVTKDQTIRATFKKKQVTDSSATINVSGSGVVDTVLRYSDLKTSPGIVTDTYTAKNSLGITERIQFHGITIPYLIKQILDVDANADTITFSSADGYSQTFDLSDSKLLEKDLDGNYPILAMGEAGTNYQDFRFVIGQYKEGELNKDLWVSYINRITITKNNIVEEVTDYTIRATANGGGKLSPEGTITVPEHGNQTFRMTANKGYVIKDVLVDGNSVGAVETYTFTNVTRNHDLKAVFAKEAPKDEEDEKDDEEEELQAGDIRISGSGVNNQVLSYEELKNSGGVTSGRYTAKNSLGQVETYHFQGITIAYLLEHILKVDEDAHQISFVSTDGYTRTYSLDKGSKLFRADKNGNLPMLAFAEGGEEYLDFRFIIGMYGANDRNKDSWVSHISKIIVHGSEEEAVELEESDEKDQETDQEDMKEESEEVTTGVGTGADSEDSETQENSTGEMDSNEFPLSVLLLLCVVIVVILFMIIKKLLRKS